MSWLRRLLGSSPPPARQPEAGHLAGPDATGDGGPDWYEEPFVCSTCGRTDLPPAGDWDPPICLECDAAINFDAIEMVEITEDW